MSTAPAAAPIPSVKIPAGTTAGAAVREAGLADQRPAGHRRGPGPERPAARPGLDPGRRHRGRGRAGRHRGRPFGDPALRRARAGPGGAAGVSGRQARHRPADPGRLLLRLRCRAAVHPGGPDRPRQAHAQDHQVRSAVLPPGRRFGGRCQGRARQGAVQARVGRSQIRRQHRDQCRGERRGRRR